ncbi:hypothetical protein [Cystobacter fuscus]|uniref:hypothetical protein n=1 Tax=Cystobacter fuscus TaxID=43 RepID=UPI002B315242|nr:hypothetical protein F0U63_26290 [Cystobacter fuscus]
MNEGDNEPTIDPFTGQVLPQELGTQDMHRLLEDGEIWGGGNITEAEVQGFLNKKSSGLRNYRDPAYGNRLAADIIANVSTARGVSPLYMLARIQTESGLVNKTVADSTSLSKATGCGCPDGGGCDVSYTGFGKQVECAAGLIRTYLDEINRNGQSRTGWRVGVAKNTLDPCTVTPRNKATVALYTYTPWVGAYAQQCGTSQWGGSSLVALNLHNFLGQHTWGQGGGLNPAHNHPSAVSMAAGTQQVYIRGPGSSLWVKGWNGSVWGSWLDLGGQLTSAPSATSPAPNVTHVYVRGTDNQLHVKGFANNTWGDWLPLGGILTSGPSAVSPNPNVTWVFIRAQDNRLWVKGWANNTWGDWVQIGGDFTFASDPSAVSMSPGTAQVYVRGHDNALWVIGFDGAQWGSWVNLGGTLSSAPAAVSASPNTTYVYGRGTDNAIHVKGFSNNTWGSWLSLGGTMTSSPTAVSDTLNTNHIYARGSDNAVWVKGFSNNTWGDWVSIGGSMPD